MGLLPLEFSDCLLDSPYFRENLRAHEKQLDQSALDIKNIISNIQDVLDTARQLSKAKRTLANSLSSFQFDCIGTSLTDDEIIIANSVKQFANFLTQVNDEMERLLDHGQEKFIAPLATFRKEQIGSVKKTKKDFDKATARFCSAQDRYVNLSSKKEESLAEAAEAVRFERRNLNESSLEYVYLMHIVQEKKKFEFVEALLSFMRAWANYYRHGQAVTQDSATYMNDLQARVQKTRDNFSAVSDQYESLKKKMVSGNQDPGIFNKMYTRQGYLYVQNKKNIIGSQWVKHYCQYQAKPQIMTLISYNQLQGKITATESIRVTSCICRDEAPEKFRFAVTGEETNNPGNIVTLTLQAMSEYERKHWVEAMGGTWPAQSTLQRIKADSVEDNLNSLAFGFLKECLAELENRGLIDQGLYRVGGVLSKVKKLLNLGLDPQPGSGRLELSDPKQWESKTIASAVKQYFRDLSKPLLTHQLYNEFVTAVKHESEAVRVQELQKVIRKLPIASREILKVLIRHLSRVAAKSDQNLMTAANIGVCFGPTLLRPREETVATIMDIKFCNEVIQILIENCDTFFPPNSSAESSPEVLRLTEVDGREQRGSSTPKRTHSFSSFSQLSTNSLPDIKELKESKLSIVGANPNSSKLNGRATTERIRSRSTQHNPIIISGPNTISVRPKNLFKSSTQDDLMASLEFMNSLAADLPNSSNGTNVSSTKGNHGPLWLPHASPLKRSHTVQARRVVKINGNSPTKILNHPQHVFSQAEVMKKPPLPKLFFAPPTPPTMSSFSVSVPVNSQQQNYPSQYVTVPDNGVVCHKSNSNLTPTVKAILSPSVCEQVYWPHQQHPQQLRHEQLPRDHTQQESKASKAKPSRPTDIFVREIHISEPTNEPEPPVPPRASSEDSPADVPPPLPARKYRRALTSNDVTQKQETHSRPEKKKPCSTTQTSPMLYRATLSTDSGVMMGSPSPPTDSGIGVSPPVKVRQQMQQKQLKKVTSVTLNNDDEELTKFGTDETNLRRCRRAPSSDDTASICSSALSVESDTSGSRYDNVVRNEPVCTESKTSTLVAAAAEIAAASYLTGTSTSSPGHADEADDENEDSSSCNSENLDLESYSDDDESDLSEPEKSGSFQQLPIQRNSGPYENFQPNDERPSHSECSSYSSNHSSPKICEKNARGSEVRPDLPPREHLSIYHRQNRMQNHNINNNDSIGNDTMCQLLAAGQTSNV